MRTADIEINGPCGSCPVALKGDRAQIKCSPCYWLARGIILSPELQEEKELFEAKRKIDAKSKLFECM
jgi:hypothetical protein